MFVFGGFHMPGEEAPIAGLGTSRSRPPQFFSHINTMEENKQLLKLVFRGERWEMSPTISQKSHIGGREQTWTAIVTCSHLPPERAPPLRCKCWTCRQARLPPSGPPGRSYRKPPPWRTGSSSWPRCWRPCRCSSPSPRAGPAWWSGCGLPWCRCSRPAQRQWVPRFSAIPPTRIKGRQLDTSLKRKQSCLRQWKVSDGPSRATAMVLFLFFLFMLHPIPFI